MLATIEEAINITDRINQDKKKAEYYLLNYEKEYLLYRDKKQEYLSYKEVAGYVMSIENGEKKHFGMQIVIEIGGNDRRYDGLYFMESK